MADDRDVTMRIWRGDSPGGDFTDYMLPSQEGEVVLDVIHRIQATSAADLACRWNCKAGKCGSCSAEINGKPRLMCMTRMDQLPRGPVTVAPMRTFPIIRDLVTDVSFNYERAKRGARLRARAPARRRLPDAAGRHRAGPGVPQVHRVLHVPGRLPRHPGPRGEQGPYAGPRFFIRYAELEMHPLDTNDRRELVRERGGLGLCNITKCCTEVCPEHIKITDNGIIPLKERVVDAAYDPVGWLGRTILRRHKASAEEAAADVP